MNIKGMDHMKSVDIRHGARTLFPLDSPSYVPSVPLFSASGATPARAPSPLRRTYALTYTLLMLSAMV